MDDMSDISPIGRPHAAAVNGSAHSAARINGSGAHAPRAADSVEFSDAARYLSQLKENEPVREDLVSRIRSQIESGTYESDAKLDAAIDALVDDLA
jgi:flagellar biosynthesis anti-sigma factor FlgM